MDNKINWEVISGFEGKGVTQGYVPDADNSQSGVTIGTGFDLGSKSKEFLENLQLDSSIVDTLTPYLGMRGAQAVESAPNLQLDQSQVDQLDLASKKWYSNNIIEQYNNANPKTKFEDLSAAQQTVVASVGFQYGDFKRVPNFFKQITTGDWEAAEANLRNFGDNYGKRRNKEADILEDERKKKIDPAELFKKSLESERDLSQPVDIKEELKSLKDKFKPRDWEDQYPIDDGKLFMDRLYEGNAFRKFITQEPTTGEEVRAAIREGTLLGNMWQMMSMQTFAGDENFMASDYEKTDRAQEYIKGYNLDNESLLWITEKANSAEHWEYLAERAAQLQRNRETLDRAGWSGIAWQIGSWLLDPVNITGYGAMAKGLSAIRAAERLTRMQKFTRSGALVAGTEATLFTPVAYNQPTLGLNDVIIASALGGTLGGGINALLAKNLQKVSKAVQRLDVEESGGKFTAAASKSSGTEQLEFDFVKLKKDLDEVDDIYDVTSVQDKDLVFPIIRNLPSGFLIQMTKSGTAGTSKSPLMKKFGFTFMEDPIGWEDTASKATKKLNERIIAQDETVEVIRDLSLSTVHAIVYPRVHQAFKEWVKKNGGWTFSRFVSVHRKAEWNKSVKQAVVALGRQNKGFNLSQQEISLLNDPHILQAANSYADGFEWFARKLKDVGVEGAEELEVFRGYVPRKISLDSFMQLEKEIGEDGVVELISKAILDEQKFLGLDRTGVGAPFPVTGGAKVGRETQQPFFDRIKVLEDKIAKLKQNPPKRQGPKTATKYNQDLSKFQKEIDDINAKLKKGETVTEQLDPNKAQVMAQAIVKMVKHNKRAGGFDLEKLLQIKDKANIRAWIDDVLEDLDDPIKDELAQKLSTNFNLLTSGRLASRIRLNENFETYIKGKLIRLDDLYENDVDNLWTAYSNEMAGWAALAERANIRSRSDLVKYKNALKSDIDASYGVETGLLQRANSEKKTVDAVFHNLFGRSAEDDPTGAFSTATRWLRRYNFTRVLNQVGIAQLPEFGVATSQQGIRTLLNEVPALRKILDRNLKELPDTFQNDMAIIGASNGDEWLYRMFSSYELAERGVANPNTFVRTRFTGKKLEATADAFEKGTGLMSGLLMIDSAQRKISMRMFVHRLAEDLIDKGVEGISKTRLNRYRILGLTEDELTKLAKEFNSKNVVTTKNFLGRRVLSFNFPEFQDQALLKKFAIAVNRYTRRAVQYNNIGDGSRFFTDTAVGKTMGQFRQFVMVAWNKQFLHNVAMADFQTFSMFMYTTMIGGMAYYAQTNFNALGMNKSEKRKYLNKRLGKNDEEFLIKMGLASFQRAGWSSLMPPIADLFTSQLAPQYRFNTRSSGTDMNLLTGNPSYDLLTKVFSTAGSVLKSTRGDYRFTKSDLNRLMRLFPYQNMYGVNQLLNFIKDSSGLPEKGTYNPY